MKVVDVIGPARYCGVHCHDLFDFHYWNLTLNHGLFDPLFFLRTAGHSVIENMENWLDKE